ncbi:pentapeptide repeat-containing protein [Campylobacter sp. LH-2024]|uniref:pentapeptide repeat-containing protein n=1 Tax=Campylobacter sp. LH-2024 TaxID=3239825 RepID=UPI00301E19C8|nr:pentapeptide repeat-containing protein [Campylobacter sp. W0046]
MGSENFIEDLKPYGILARDAKRFKKWKTRIFISNAVIEEVDFKTLQEEGIKKLYVYDCKISNIKFSNQNDLRIYFVKCNFLDQVIASKCNFEKEVSFDKAIFQKEASFSNCNFKDKANFKRFISVALSPNDEDYNELNILFENCIFNKRADFHSSKIANGIYFTDSHFKDYADFHACKFEKNTCFYRVKFEKVPNFSQAIFKGNLNVVNANLNFDFDDLKEKINQECEEFNKNKKEEDEKPLDKFANDFRDSFRIFKNALIKDNNLLDASNFHKYELYCKEIELNSKKPKKFSKEWLDKYQLMFYRKLCDHHTNLILNLKWLIYVIALYILLLGKIFFMYPLCIVVLMVCKYFFKIKNIKVFVSLAIIFMSVCSEPKLIFGVSNLFLDDLNWWQNLVTAIYILTMALVLFSLQKTARKNSIVPS